MRKKYITADIKIVSTNLEVFICASKDIKVPNGTTGEDLFYGGVDNDGSKEPGARRYNVWDDEDEN